ncbi:MAG: dihydroorotate dehydrogenase [Candidatus Marinimicrobia bacterium]|nr:dihydroorotate dehydrogenase [Candidatus Neomarinimicrobiota bacterium]MCF7880584.1 dihydroorotate dehydrogenase [Candidatus Neomarinimicrobiota bacterium]
MADLTTYLDQLTLKNPVMTASGTFGYGDELPDYVDLGAFGGIVTKSLTGQPREGNAPPRIVETSSGMLNSIGLANIGVEAFIREKLPIVREKDMVLIVNIAGSKMEEYCRVLELLDAEEGIDGYEINVSCPNVKEGGMEFGVSEPHLEKLISQLRALTDRPIITKLSPNVTSIQSMAKAAVNGGTDILSLVNTLVGSKIDIERQEPVLSTVFGGLSGPAIKPVAIAQVFKVSEAVDVPIIGIGGIKTAADIIEFLMAGASAIEIGTLNYRDPGLGPKLVPEITKWLDEHDFTTLEEIIGIAHE